MKSDGTQTDHVIQQLVGVWYVFFFYQNIHHNLQTKKYIKQKSHRGEEGGAHLNFFLVFIDELEKQIIIKRTVEVGQ